ncbi:uncharacterized protein LOC106073793 [Biomphalaria glabrata]|uniref:Uncharacterized protein LOC106073793 n=1 Tax=Biomphalaria glabrata TaxID=6526 RepID=A0A9W2YWM7_BIOGL|nr:uncharacterized protein LOC106073793 [Biomphalaria glabrata]
MKVAYFLISFAALFVSLPFAECTVNCMEYWESCDGLSGKFSVCGFCNTGLYVSCVERNKMFSNCPKLRIRLTTQQVRFDSVSQNCMLLSPSCVDIKIKTNTAISAPSPSSSVPSSPPV